eukprot:Em0001g2409a
MWSNRHPGDNCVILHEFSSDITDKSKVAGLPTDQLGTRRSAGREWRRSLKATTNLNLTILQKILLKLVVVEDSHPCLGTQDVHGMSWAVRATAFVSCLNNTDCYPTVLKGSAVPSDYIKCESYNCICSGNCFKLNGFICDFSVWGEYSNATNNCTTASDLKDQKTAFLLSLFLSSIGAANFYIGRNDLAIPQLVMTVVIVIPVALAIHCYCSLRALKRGKGLGPLAFVLLSYGAVILVILVILVLIIISWWIADLVVFVNNERTDGSGCPLTASL